MQENSEFQVVERLQERTSVRFVKKIVGIPVPLIVKEFVEVVHIIPQDRVQHHTVGETFNVSVPQFVEKILEVVKVIPLERFSEYLVVQFVNAPVPQVVEEIVEVVRLFRRDGSNSAPMKRSCKFLHRSRSRLLNRSMCFHRHACRFERWSRSWT